MSDIVAGHPLPYSAERAVAARNRDQRAGRPTFYIIRYADDFVVLTTGNKHEAEAERDALALFLREELRLELSKEKTLVTAAEDGFHFVGFRLKKDRTRARRMVCKLYIPRDKLRNLHRKIKGLTDRSTTGQSARRLIRELNPLITGWRNYYRFVMGAYREYKKLDWWLWWRLFGWMRKKHPKTPSRVIADRFLAKRKGASRRWMAGGAILRQFTEGGTGPYPFRGIRITNGWDASPDKWFRPVPGDFRETMNTLWTM